MGTGSPQRAQEIERARSDVLDQLSKVDDRSGDARDVLPQLYKAFIYREIEALAKADTKGPDSLTHIPLQQRKVAADALKTLTKDGLIGFALYPWNDHAERVADGLHPERGRSRGRGLGLF